MNKFNLNEGKNKTIKKSKSFALIVICLFSLVFFFNSLSASTYSDCSVFGNCPKPFQGITFDNNTGSVNSSEYWDNLNTFNATQMENSNNQLNILPSWLSTFIHSIIDPIFTKVSTNVSSVNTTKNIQELLNWTGIYSARNPFDQSLNTTDNVIFNNLNLTSNLNVSGMLYVNSTNVIIGTNNPTTSAKVYANGKGIFGNSITATRDALGSGQRAFALIDTSAVLKVFRVDVANAATIEFIMGVDNTISPTTNRWWDMGADKTGFYIRDRTNNNLIRLFIQDATGRVGIRNTNPIYTLDINGNTSSKLYYSENKAGINISGTTCTITEITNGIITGGSCT